MTDQKALTADQTEQHRTAHKERICCKISINETHISGPAATYSHGVDSPAEINGVSAEVAERHVTPAGKASLPA